MYSVNKNFNDSEKIRYIMISAHRLESYFDNDGNMEDLLKIMKKFDKKFLKKMVNSFSDEDDEENFPKTKHMKLVVSLGYHPKKSYKYKFNPSTDFEAFAKKNKINYRKCAVFELSESIKLSQIDILSNFIVPISKSESFQGGLFDEEPLNEISYDDENRVIKYSFN